MKQKQNLRFVRPTPPELLQMQQHSMLMYVPELLSKKEFTHHHDALDLTVREVMPFFDQLDYRITFGYRLYHDSLDVGYMLYFFNPRERNAFLGYIFIDPLYRGRGYGEQALMLFETDVKSRGADHIFFYVFIDNKIAQRLYHRCGYQIVETAGFNEATDITRHRMEKFLK